MVNISETFIKMAMTDIGDDFFTVIKKIDLIESESYRGNQFLAFMSPKGTVFTLQNSLPERKHILFQPQVMPLL